MSLTARTLVACIGALPMFLFVAPAAAQNCPVSRPGVDLELLYRYSQHAQAAYGETAANACNADRLHNAAEIDLAGINTVPLSVNEYLSQNLDGGPDGGPVINVYKVAGSGEYTVTCRRDDRVPAVTLSILRHRLSREESPLIFIMRLSPVLQTDLAGVLTEELVLTSSNSSSGNQPERLWAVRGTELTWPRILPNFLNLLNGSCVFEIAAQVVIEDSWQGSKSVVGHSLGGSVTQYVAQTYASQGSQSSSSFSAYSFNGFGLPDDPVPLPNLYSYQVTGEFVAWSGDQLNRTQGGHVIRYVPPSDHWPMAMGWPMTMGWQRGFMLAMLAFKRHEIRVVQDSLCECAKGSGRIEYRAP